MSFREKSAWVMSAALLLSGMFYFAQIVSISSSLGELARPTIPIIVVYTIVLVVVAALSHIAISVFAPTDANEADDERDRKIFDRAGHLSNYFLTMGVLLSLAFYLISYDGNLLYYGVFASIIICHLAEYALQIYLYRAGS